MNIRQIVVVFMTVSFVFATATSTAAEKSEALQVAHAAGLKQIKDVRHVDLENALKEKPDMTLSNVITSVGVGTEVFTQQTGWSLGGETAALGALTLLSALPVHKPERHTRFLAWMPRTMAPDKNAAASLFRDTIERAFARALPEYAVSIKQKTFGKSSSREISYLAVSSQQCSDCGVYSRSIFHDLVKPKTRKAPKNIGGYDSYRWSVGGVENADFNGFPMTAEHLTAEERLNILTEVSRHLPSWIYIYVAPAETLASIPILLHEGEPMLFIEPVE